MVERSYLRESVPMRGSVRLDCVGWHWPRKSHKICFTQRPSHTCSKIRADGYDALFHGYNSSRITALRLFCLIDLTIAVPGIGDLVVFTT